MRASSAMTRKSQQRAMSEPPATAAPWTRAMVGFDARHRLMKSWVFLHMPVKSRVGSQGMSCDPPAGPRCSA